MPSPLKHQFYQAQQKLNICIGARLSASEVLPANIMHFFLPICDIPSKEP